MHVPSRVLLVGAVVATPLFVLLWAAQALTRDGFRPTYHPMSLLSLGDWGWVQIANFVVVGLLLVGGGIGIGRSLGGGRLVAWIRILIVLIGLGLIVSGVFVTDAGAGFPAGAPEGAPLLSWNGALHQAGFVLTQLAFLGASVVLAVWFAKRRRTVWAVACIAAAAAAVLVAALGAPETLAIRLVASSAIELGLISAVALDLIVRRTASPADISTDGAVLADRL
jgi:hypothetical protein